MKRRGISCRELVERNGPMDLPVAVVAHRGDSDAAPENTLAAMRLAIEAKAHAAEFDVRATRDGRLVVFHDGRLGRTTNGMGLLSRRSFESLRKLDAGKWFGKAFRGERVPALEEVLDALGKGGLLPCVELKVGAKGAVGREVLDLLRDRNLLARSMLIVGSLAAAAAIRDAEPRAHLLSLAATKRAARRVLASGLVDGVAPRRDVASQALVDSARSLGLWVVPWTANKSKEMRRLARLGADGIISDRPGRLREVLQE